jgi:hypothetical protein
MSHLIVINDSISGEREQLDLYCGESLASNLRRHWPGGIPGPWRIYRDAVGTSNEIAALDLPRVVVAPFQVYVLTRGTAADPASFFINLAISLALSYISTLLVRKPQPPFRRAAEDRESGNNQLAAQSNQVRLGGRVPELLGTVRSYPDLLCYPIEEYWQRTQNILQYFVVGLGDHQIPADLVKLGDSPVTQIGNATAHVFHPGESLPALPCLRESPEVAGISLNPDGDTVTPVTDAVFDAATKTMTTTEYIDLEAETPITIASTSFNNGFRWCMGAPTILDGPPYVYQLDGPIVNESGSAPTIYQWEQVQSIMEWAAWWGTASTYPPTATNQDIRVNGEMFHVGDVIYTTDQAIDPGLNYVRGTITYAESFPVTIGGITSPTQILRVTDVNGVVFTIVPVYTETGYISEYRFPSARGVAGVLDVPVPEPTGWYTAPMEDPDEIWIDVGFPQGLALYATVGTDRLSIQVKAEFRRADATDPQAEIIFPTYEASTNSPLRFTQRVTRTMLDTAGLPSTGSPWIQVRLTRVTPYYQNDGDHTYTQDTRWQRLQAMRLLPPQSYPDVTIISLSMSNTRNAVQMGQTNLNCVATRILPTWTGSAFSTPAPTEKWADNFVHRCRAADGAAKPPEQIDLTGIYALQAYLDTLDPLGDGTGAQGKISMTLDQTQDIDAELSQVADVVRAVVYRVGKKIFVTRDQANATSLALFNGRAKSPDAESVAIRMTNEAENDGATVTWLDVAAGYKVREYTYPDDTLVLNPLRASAICANWPQAWRRAVYELNRIKYRREQITVNVTEDGRICRPGDVVNVTDDIANLATTAGEVLYVSGLVLTLDRDVTFTAGHTHSILLRDVLGQTTDSIPVVAVPGSPHKVQLGRAPVGITIKPRDSSMGTLFAFFDDAAANVRRWLLTGVALSGPYVKLEGANYSALVYQGDSATLPPMPPIVVPV